MLENYSELLERYAELLVKVGLNLQHGQRLLIQTTGLECAPLVRLVARHAYQVGADLVTVIWGDEELTRIRVDHARKETLSGGVTWPVNGRIEVLENGGALLSIYSPNPDIFTGVDPEALGLIRKGDAERLRPALELGAKQLYNWLVASYPTPGWAARVFPGKEPKKALDALTEQIFNICRVNVPDPVAAWSAHAATLKARAAYMNAKNYYALHFKGPGTDLVVGLAEGHQWMGGGGITRDGLQYMPNIPTEEIFTAPHHSRVEGVVRATMPLNLSDLVEDFSVSFREGRVTAIEARKGGEHLQKVLEMDEGASHLGEIALVPHSSPISQSGLLFYNTLYDENAASHLALGRCYTDNLKGGVGLSREEVHARGGNFSIAHVDFMVGSGEIDVDGLTATGEREPVMRQGEWV